MDESTITKLVVQAQQELANAGQPAELEHWRVSYLGRKGKLVDLMAVVAKLPPDQRPRAGQLLNRAKGQLLAMYQQAASDRAGVTGAKIDPNVPGEQSELGHLHPLTQMSREIIAVWRSLGYDVHEGPELEDQWFNFEGLNMPPDHPARDIQDTFYIKDHPELLLRTHCSTVQLRSVNHRPPPLKFVELGRVYRHEATDATHEAMFSHCDGIVIDQDLTMAHLVTTLKVFINRLFPDSRVRVRPSFFPFVEPGIEVDMEWERNGKKEWLEMLGAGMVHPKVLQAMKLSPDEWTGFAFGVGVERLAMIRYGIPDIRLFFNGNLDFLKQF